MKLHLRIVVIITCILISFGSYAEEDDYSASALLFIERIALNKLIDGYLPELKNEIRAGIQRVTALPQWRIQKTSTADEEYLDINKRFNAWLNAIDAYDFNGDVRDILTETLTLDELNAINQFLHSSAGKKVVELVWLDTGMMRKGFAESDENIAKFFAEDLDAFIVFSNTASGRKLFEYYPEDKSHTPKVIMVNYIRMNDVIEQLVTDFKLERFRYAYNKATRSIIVANHDLLTGAVLNNETLALREYPKDDIASEAFYLDDLDYIAGGKLTAEIKDGTPLTWSAIDHTKVVVAASNLPSGTIIDITNVLARKIVPAQVRDDYLTLKKFPTVEYSALKTDALEGQPILKSSIISLNLSCDLIDGLSSVNSDNKISVTFRNTRADIVELNWIDFKGKEVSYGSIGINEMKSMETYVTHPWVIRNKQGDCLTMFNFTENSKVVIK